MHWMALWCLKQHEKVYSALYGEHRRACILSCPSAASSVRLSDDAVLNSSYNAFDLRWPLTIGLCRQAQTRQRTAIGRSPLVL